MDSKPLTQEEIIKGIYKESFGYGSQVVTIDKIFRFARLTRTTTWSKRCTLN
jgi:hypothetical protein